MNVELPDNFETHLLDLKKETDRNKVRKYFQNNLDESLLGCRKPYLLYWMERKKWIVRSVTKFVSAGKESEFFS